MDIRLKVTKSIMLRQRCGFKNLLAVGAVALSVLIGASGLVSAAGDPVFKRIVLFENREVEVVELRYEPGSQTPLHTHKYPHRVLYIESGGTLTIIPGTKRADGSLALVPGGKAGTVKVTAGQTLFLPTATHVLRNTGKTFIRVIEVELKISDPKTPPAVK